MEADEVEGIDDLSVALFAKNIMRNRSRAEALPIFYSAWKWRGDPPGREEVEGGSHNVLLKINDSNKCHCLSPPIESHPAVNHDQAEACWQDTQACPLHLVQEING
jgi:hypothetical protein